MGNAIFFMNKQYSGGAGGSVNIEGMDWDDYENLSPEAQHDGTVRFLKNAPASDNYYYDETTETLTFSVSYATYDSATETINIPV